ncbi:MAG: ABC-2 transporter permease [Eubacteriales bacterium]|nr:ABC-2 transporter permease [Eubacteriales bacterium]
MLGFFYKDIHKTRMIMSLILGVALVVAAFLLTTYYFYGAAGEIENSDILMLPLTSAAAYYLLFFLLDWAMQDSFVGEDQSIWQCFVMATPGTMKAQIQSKFCLTIFLNICMLVFCELMDMIACLLFGDMTVSTAILPVLLVCWNLTKSAFTLPFMFACGNKQSNAIKLIFFAFIVLLIAVYGLFGDISWALHGNILENIRKFFIEGNGIWILGIFPYVAAALYYISYCICLKVYRKGLENIE